MSSDGDKSSFSRWSVQFEPGSGVAIVGPTGCVFLPEPEAHPVLQQLVDLVIAGSPGLASAVLRMLFGSSLKIVPPFVVAELVAHEVSVVVRGEIPLVAVGADGDDRFSNDPQSVAFERTLTGITALGIGKEPSSFYRLSGLGIVPCDGLRLVAGADRVADTASLDDWKAASGRGAFDSGHGRTPSPEAASEPDSSWRPSWEEGQDGLDAGADDQPPVLAVEGNWQVVDAEFAEHEPAPLVDDTGAAGLPLCDVGDIFGDIAPPSSAVLPSEEYVLPPPPPSPALAPAVLQVGTSNPGTAENVGLMTGDGSLIEATRNQLRREAISEGAVVSSPSSSLVRGHTCPNGHLNETTVAICRACSTLIPLNSSTTTGPRPRLGILEFDDGRQVNLDRPVVLGRNPPNDSVLGGETAMPLNVSDVDMRVSSLHVQIYFSGWTVLIENPGSTNSTRLTAPGGQRTELVKGVPVPLQPGTHVNLADRRSFTYLLP